MPEATLPDCRLTETVEVPHLVRVEDTPRGVPSPLVMPDHSREPQRIERPVQVHVGLDHFGASISFLVCRWCGQPLANRTDLMQLHSAWHLAHQLHHPTCDWPLRHPSAQHLPCRCGLIVTQPTHCMREHAS